MWYECLPSFCIIVAAMAVPAASSFVLNKLVVGNGFRRELVEKHQKLQYMRDVRLCGDAYKVVGLEAIPDK